MLAYKSVMRIAVGGVIGLITAIGYLIQPVAAMTPFEQGIETERGIIQELLGQAIVDATKAQTVIQKAKAQEALGLLIIMTAARLDQMQPIEMSGAQKIPTAVAAATPAEEVRGQTQGLLGGAIVDAALAKTDQEKARTQEALGRLIVTASLIEMRLSPIQQTTFVMPSYGETRGEVVFWPVAAIGAFLFGLVMLGLQAGMEAAVPAGEVAEKEEEKEVPLRKAA